MKNDTYGIQIVARENNARSSLIYGTAAELCDALSASVDNDSHKTTKEDLVIVVLETDSDGNPISQFSTKPLVTVDSFIDLMLKESRDV